MWLLRGAKGKAAAGVTTAYREHAGSLVLPTAVNSSPIPVPEDHKHMTPAMAKAVVCEEKRVQREKEWLEDLIVFKGGAIQDHKTLGRKMIYRDFIHYALYHPRWGYHPKMCKKYKELVTTGFFEPIAFSATRGRSDYEYCMERLQESTPTYITTSQLFQPVYSWAFCEYMLHTMRSKFHPTEPLIVYELGAGSGQFAQAFMDFLFENHPEVYSTCEYHMIDINPVMVEIQRTKLIHHQAKVRLHNMSVLNWKEHVPQRCFVVAFDLLDQMPHDMIIHSKDGACYEHHVEFVEKDNLAHSRERFNSVTDPLILRYLRYSQLLQESSIHALRVLCLTDGKENIDPPRWQNIEPTLYDPTLVILTKAITLNNPFRHVYVPTGQLLLFEMLAKYFPRHHAIFGDWNSVAHSLGGLNAPVIQSKLRLAKDLFIRRSSDHLLQNGGMVDICYPTDFEMMRRVYHHVCGSDKEIGISTHPEWWSIHGGDKTQLFNTKTGFNPLLEDFQMYSIFTSHHPAEG